METQSPQRRTPRYAFGGVAEVTGSKAGRYLIAVTRELGLLGCFVKTTAPFPAGESVGLRITHHGEEFAVLGQVAYVLPTDGMGIVFGPVSVADRSILESWLDEIRFEHSQRNS